MRDEELINFRGVIDHLDNPGILFMWSTLPRLDFALKLIEKWGLCYRGVAWIWIKTNKDGSIMGAKGPQTNTVKQTCELVLMASWSKDCKIPKTQDQTIHNALLSQRREHSRKPDEIRDRIVKLIGNLPRIELFCRDDGIKNLFNEKRKDIHKGDRGHLLILAGSIGKTGAATLAAMGALRAGAGLVTLGIPKSLNSILEAKLTEAMTAPLPETGDGTLSLKAKEEIYRLMEGKSALAIGPGLSTNPETSALIREIVAGCGGLPMVIDADGLNALAGDRRAMKGLDKKKILTPHPGEMARLTGLKNNEVQIDRVGTASRFVEEHGCCLVLKGARTLIAEPNGNIYLNPTGNPALSSGGAGDVLTGLISGFLARGWPLIDAANVGVYLHGLAADLLAEDMGEAGVLAGELPDLIPGLMDTLARKEWPLETVPPYMDLYQPL
jgi:hydroxyethylthiazole kinase-like uncharacterized protein yjeF